MLVLEHGRQKLYQWDVNQRLIIGSENITEVHFANKETDLAPVCEVYQENGQFFADIPNILLQDALPLYAYGCCADCVRAAVSFEVVRRCKPSDYVYTETEVKRYSDLEERIKVLEQGGGGSGSGGSGSGGDGKDGFSPIVNATEVSGGYRIDITDAEGTESITLRHGKDGKDGSDGEKGEPGKDGYTPVKGVDYFDGAPGKDGEKGEPGKDGYTPQKGVDYFDGAPGKDGEKGDPGFSPIVSVEDFDGGHRVTITDAEGEKSFDVLEVDRAQIVEDVLAALPGQDDGTTDGPLWSATFTDLAASAHNHVTMGFELEPGKTYEVHFDGEVYSLTCEHLAQHAMYAIGNQAVVGSGFVDTGEPFFIYQKSGSSSSAGNQYLLVRTSGSHDIEIYDPATSGGESGGHFGNAYLSGKKILILGDSINEGAGWAGGYVNLFAEDFPEAIVHNAAVSGSKLAGEQIYYQMVREFQAGFTPDYIVFDGGGNDMLNDVAVGALDPDVYSADGEGDEFDTSTMVGAFEHLITNTQTYLPNAKLIFVSLYKLHPDATELTYAAQRQTWKLLRETCEKYGVVYVDLYSEGNFTPANPVQWNAYMYDWVHINEAGYRRFWPLIRAALLEA